MSLETELAEAAEELDPVDADGGPDGIEWRRDGRLFAVASGERAEFLLDAAVARAATRTPDTAPSGRGPGWIEFRPAELDEHALDRAVAWLASAWRRAERD